MAELTTARRERLKDSDFALPGRRYPIQDLSHARNALAMVAQHGTPEEQATVRAAVKRRYPEIGQDREDGERHRRTDLAGGDLNLKPAHRTDEGYLYAEGQFTRAGVFVYHVRRSDGTMAQRRELRPPEEVFDAASLASMVRKPVTNGHPPVMVSPDNAGDYLVGSVGEAVQQVAGGFGRVTLALHRQDGIEAAQGGRLELSAGYTCDLDPTPGEWRGMDGDQTPERYDAIQRGIRYNHLALVDRGRAGHAARMRLDSGDGVMDGLEGALAPLPTETPTRTRSAPMRVTIDGVDHDLEDSGLAQAIANQTKALATATERADTADATVAKLTQERDNLQGRVDAAPDQAALDAERLAYFTKRQDLLGLATGRLDGVDVSALSNEALAVTIAKAIRGDSLPAEASQDYIQGVLDMARQSAPRHDSLAALAASSVPSMRQDAHHRPASYREDMVAAEAALDATNTACQGA